MMNYKDLQKRRKIIDVAPDFILNCLRGFQDHQYYRMPRIDGLPQNAILHDVFYDVGRHCFSIIVLCEDWPEVEPGNVTPSMSVHLYEDVYLVNCNKNGILLNRME